MRKYLFSGTLWMLLVTLGLLVLDIGLKRLATVPDPPIFDMPDFVQQPSSIGTQEDPKARAKFEIRRLIDPSTGLVPHDIKRQEFLFAQSHPRQTESAFRISESGQVESWAQAGPFNYAGRTRALAMDVRNENVMLAGGVSGGMWRSANGGQSWDKVTSPMSIHSATCIAQDLRNGKQDTWYYGSGEVIGNSAAGGNAPFRGDGLFKSEDNGLSWQQIPSTVSDNVTLFTNPFQYVWRIVTNPANQTQDEVYAAVVGGIMRSIDGGESWDLVLGASAPTSTNLNNTNLSAYTDIVRTNNGVFYATLSQEGLNGNNAPQSGVFRSANGINWVRISNFTLPQGFRRIVIADCPSNPNKLYFLMHAGDDFLFEYNFLSGNGTGPGGRWLNRSTNLPAYGGQVGDFNAQGSYNMVIKVHPNDDNLVFIGGTNLYRSTDGYSSSTNHAWIGGYDTANTAAVYPNHYVDQHEILFYPSNPSRMITANDGGLFITENCRAPRVSWRPLNNGYYTTQFYTMALEHGRPGGVIMGGAQDNGTVAATDPDAIRSWNRLLSGDGGFCAVAEEGFYYYVAFQNSQIYRLTLNNQLSVTSFARVDPTGAANRPNQPYLFVNPYVLDPNNSNRMYLAGGHSVWRNDNLGQIIAGKQVTTSLNWTSLDRSAVPSGQISALTVSWQPSDVVYYGTTNGRVFKIDNANSNSYAISEITASMFPNQGYVTCLAVDRTNANHVMVAFSNYNVQSIFSSTDGGATFEAVSGNLEENSDGSGGGPSVRWLCMAPLQNGDIRYFAATSTGLYTTTDLNGMATEWARESNELIGNMVVNMVDYRYADGLVVAATHGNGMFRARYTDILPLERADAENEVAMGNPYPNPFVDAIDIPFSLPSNGNVRARIYDASGRYIKTLLWSKSYRGENLLSWDGTNATGTPVEPGVYICRLEFDNKITSTRLLKISE